MRPFLLPLLLASSFSLAQEPQEATVGDFGSNNQQSAESIDNRTTTTVPATIKTFVRLADLRVYKHKFLV